MTHDELVQRVAAEIDKFSSQFYWHNETGDPNPSIDAARAAIDTVLDPANITDEIVGSAWAIYCERLQIDNFTLLGMRKILEHALACLRVASNA